LPPSFPAIFLSEEIVLSLVLSESRSKRLGMGFCSGKMVWHKKDWVKIRRGDREELRVLWNEGKG
jgi:hypothetical protein